MLSSPATSHPSYAGPTHLFTGGPLFGPASDSRDVNGWRSTDPAGWDGGWAAKANPCSDALTGHTFHSPAFYGALRFSLPTFQVISGVLAKCRRHGSLVIEWVDGSAFFQDFNGANDSLYQPPRLVNTRLTLECCPSFSELCSRSR
jgi:hypothetical protein